MRRADSLPRPDYLEKIASVGLAWGEEYWSESVHYQFTRREIDDIESATNELHARCVEAVQFVMDHKRYTELGIPDYAIPFIEKSWEEEWPSLYGRFDLAYDGATPPKLLEYNADTPTALLEAAVAQWYWLRDGYPAGDQFNSIHERLIAKWVELKQYLKPGPVHFCSVDDVEDGMTVTYLADTAVQAGLDVRTMPIEEIGWSGKAFVDSENAPLSNVFKLYPWEFLFEEEFFAHMLTAGSEVFWMEPPWKVILSCKGILPVLHEMFPFHPNILPAYSDGPREMAEFVRKPLFSREGEGVEILRRGDSMPEAGGSVFQQLARLPRHGGRVPVIGSWVIDGEAAGIGIRESEGPITGNRSTFVPHRIE